MNCPQCGQPVAEGSAACSSCGAQLAWPAPEGAAPQQSYAAPQEPAPQQSYTAPQEPAPQQPPNYGAPPGASSPYTTQPASSSGLPPAKFNASNLTTFEWVGAVGTFILFISLFFDWFSAGGCFTTAFGTVCGGGSDNALFRGYMYIVLILCLVLLAFYVSKALWGKLPFTLPFPEATAVLIANGLNLLLVIIAMISAPGGASLAFGAWLGLLAALAASTPSAMPHIQKYLAQRNA